MPGRLLFPYPHPKTLGLILDPKEKATVLRVEEKSPAEKAGFRKGDAILTLEGQPPLRRHEAGVARGRQHRALATLRPYVSQLGAELGIERLEKTRR